MYLTDSFKTSRILAVQPKFTSSALSQPVMHTEDPAILLYMTNILRLWSIHRKDIPPTFVDEVQILKLARQPISIISSVIEITKREILATKQPFKGSNVNNMPWNSRNPFELLPLCAGQFPASLISKVDRVPGGESVEDCRDCNSNGIVACLGCAQGRVVCPDCRGTQTINCPRCLGSGMHLGARGNMINCQSCQGRRTRRCNRCSRGEVICSVCNGSGTKTCLPCEGHGRIHTYYQIRTSTRVGKSLKASHDVELPFELTVLESDLDNLGNKTFVWPNLDIHEKAINQSFPTALSNSILQFSKSEVLRCNDAIAPDEKATAINIRVGGGYVYSVEYLYRDQTKKVFVGGIHNRVFSETRSSKSGRIFGGLKRLGYQIMNSVTNYSSPIDREYLQAVQQGSVHVGDTRCLLPATARILDLGLEVTEDGYQLHLSGKLGFIVAWIDFDSSRRAILCASRDLGPAERHRFAQAMQANNKLMFGRIAVSIHDTGTRFTIEDRRPYEGLLAEDLALVMKCIIADSNTILVKGWLT